MILKLSGWARNKFIASKVHSPKNLSELKNIRKNRVIARGMGRSYGDSAIQPKCTILTTNLKKIITFDKKKGVINVESGITIKELLETTIPNNWILPVIPGSKYITIGGMVASDVHGKNHHKVGSFRNFISEIKLLTNKNKITTCSKRKNQNLFNFTIAGMGLTGIIYSCKFKLLKISSDIIEQKIIKNKNLNETLDSLKDNNNYAYTAAWIDSSASGDTKGRSILYCGNHKNIKKKSVFLQKKRLGILFNLPNWFMSNHLIKFLNSVYFNVITPKEKDVSLNDFFFQLDKIKNWNLIYGNKGFVSYQCVIPIDKGKKGLKEILDVLIKNKVYSFVSVIKLLGKNDGFLSFGIKGYTIVFDFPMSKNLDFVLSQLDSIVIKYYGKIYLTKDSRLKSKTFFKTNKKKILENFKKLRKGDIFYESSQSKRIGI